VKSVIEQTIGNKVDSSSQKKKLKIIDCDVHPVLEGGIKKLYPYMPSSYVSKFERENYNVTANMRVRYPHPHGRVSRVDASPGEGISPGSDPHFVVKDYLDKFNIYSSLLIPLQPGNFALTSVDNNAIITLISAFNDYFIEHWLQVDNRFNLAITVNPRDIESGVKEIQRLANVPGVASVYLPLIDISLGNKYYYPIFKAAVENNLPITIHIAGPECTFVGAPTTAGGLPTTYAERFSLIAQIAQSNIASLIFNGVLEEFPNLRIIFVEWGFSWLGPLTWRMNQMWRSLRIETPWVKKIPEEYIRENIFFTTQPVEEELNNEDFSYLLRLINAKDNLIFSSDYPHWDNDFPDRTFMRLPEDMKEAIFHKNAEKVFGQRLRN
jgi:predicted TIM-barrel fold metal-dependent hydrolase